MLISYGKRINLGRVHILYGGFGSEGPHYHLDNHTAYCVGSVDCLLFSCKECLISGAFSHQGGSRGREQGCAHPPPPGDDLGYSNTTGILQNMAICMICILSSSFYVIAWSKASFFAFAFKICLRH